MSDRSVESPFQFISYKIDLIDLKTKPLLDILTNTASIPADQVRLSFAFRNVSKFSKDGKNTYVGGLNVKIDVQLPSSPDPILTGVFGIAGVFTTIGQIESDVEQNLVKVNIPALLFPYIRATITTTLSNAGFGIVMLPLINVYEAAKNAEIQILDSEKKSE